MSVSTSRSGTIPLVAARRLEPGKSPEGVVEGAGRIDGSIGKVRVDRLADEFSQGSLLAATPLVEALALLGRQVDLGASRRHIQRIIQHRGEGPLAGTNRGVSESIRASGRYRNSWRRQGGAGSRNPRSSSAGCSGFPPRWIETRCVQGARSP